MSPVAVTAVVPDEGAFQRGFAAALLGDADAPGAHPLAAQPGFAVYRNTVLRGLVDALAANHPSVRSLLGEDAFHAVAAAHARAAPPRDAALAGYGAGFADTLQHWIAREGAVEELPYLVDVARLDRLWTEAHLAADAPALRLEDLAGLEPAELLALRLVPHPALRRFTSSGTPAFTIWRRHREGGDMAADLDWGTEAALLVRPAMQVGWHPLPLHSLPLLAALLDGATVGDALPSFDDPASAAGSDTTAAVGAVAGWIDAGAFRREPRS